MSASRYFDQIAIALSAVCIVHCLAVPLIIALLPLAAITFGSESHFHAWLLGLVVPTSALGFGLGFRLHRRTDIVIGGLVGVIVLAVAGLWGHNAWAYSAEILVSVAGSVILGVAHWHNFREVRRLHKHE
jgi:hypothetical protein